MDVICRRIDDDFLDPLTFRADSEEALRLIAALSQPPEAEHAAQQQQQQQQ